LSDLEKRRRFDSGEIDAAGAETMRQRYYKDYAAETPAGHPYEDQSGFADFADADDLFAQIFRQRAGETRYRRGQDLHYHLPVEFLDAVNGGTKRLTLPDGATLDVAIPAGLQEGQVLRLRGKGAPPHGEGGPGDALVEVSIKPHRHFTRHGDDIQIEMPVTLSEAILGAKIKVPTPTGTVMVTVPKGSNSGSTLRLKGKGVPRPGGHGDELVKLKVMLPTEPDAELEAFLAKCTPGPNYDPRREMMP